MKFWRTRRWMTWLRSEGRRGRRRWRVRKERLNGSCLRGGRGSTRHHPRRNSRISNWSQHSVECSLHFPERPCKNFVFPALLSGQICLERREKRLTWKTFSHDWILRIYIHDCQMSIACMEALVLHPRISFSNACKPCKHWIDCQNSIKIWKCKYQPWATSGLSLDFLFLCYRTLSLRFVVFPGFLPTVHIVRRGRPLTVSVGRWGRIHHDFRGWSTNSIRTLWGRWGIIWR